MKTAKEMFRKLGYERDDSDKDCIEYKQYFEEVEGAFIISFDMLSDVCEFRFEEELESLRCTINAKELAAINRQMIEFGWINDRNAPMKLDYEGDGYDDKGEIVYDTAICPSCSRIFEVYYDEHSKFCPNCGQALDWEGN